MKKLLMYLVVAIVVVTCGFSIYYVVRNNEEIKALELTDKVFYMNEGETLSIPLEYSNPSPHTDFTYTIEQGYEDYVTIDLENWTITANKSGLVNVVFTSTNDEYSKFEVPCKIGNGSMTSPWYIRNGEDLQNIGKGNYLYSDSYEITTDISVGEMLPIGVEINDDGSISVHEFTGSISGGTKRYAIKDAVVKQGDLNFNVGGIFAIVGSTGKIENVRFENISVVGEYAYAGVVAGANYGLIGMCEVKDSEVVNTLETMSFTGGICGLNQHYPGSSNYAQVNICSSDVSITSKWVAGGAVGYNKGGVIFNCLIKTRSLDLQVKEGESSIYSYFGGVAGVSVCAVNGEDSYDSYVSNCLVYINGVKSTESHIAGVFGAYYGVSGVYEAQGNYNMIFYIAESSIKPYYLHDDEQIISDANPNSAKNYVKQISSEEALQKTTYTSIPNNRWDFDYIWVIDDQLRYIDLQFTTNEEGDNPYQYFPANGSTYIVNSEETFKEAFDNMRGKPSQSIVYVFEKSIVLDCSDEVWTPIGTKESPFMGQIIMEENVYIVLKNVTVSSATYTGLFGYVSGVNTIIQNIYIDNLTINGGTVVGGIVGFNDGATIQNCVINNFNICGDKYIGTFAGFNSGTIANCKFNISYDTRDVKDEEGDIIGNIDIYGCTETNGTKEYQELENPAIIIDEEGEFLLAISGKKVYDTVYELIVTEGADGAESSEEYVELDSDEVLAYDEKTKEPIAFLYGEGQTSISDQHSQIMYVGGFIGKNQGSLNSGVGLKNYISVDFIGTDNSLYIGGVVGLNSGIVNDVWISDLTMAASKYSGLVYAGGIAGFQDSGKISSCVVNATNNIEFSVNNTSSMAGGIAGFLGAESSILYSSVDVMTITACSAGGFVGIGNGLIQESYVTKNTTLNAAYAGGFACTLNGQINNCMSAASVNGSVIQAGMTVYLRKGSHIDKCYVDIGFGTNNVGATYAETSSYFRVKENEEKFGCITNTLFVGNTGKSKLVFGYPIYLQYGLVNGTLAPYVTIGGANAQVQAYFVWWWKGFSGNAKDAVVTSTSSLCGQGSALISMGFDQFVWGYNTGENNYVIPANAAGNDADCRNI